MGCLGPRRDHGALFLGQSGEQVQDERIDIRPKLRDRSGTRWAISPEMK
jgi:hypothetical protein